MRAARITTKDDMMLTDSLPTTVLTASPSTTTVSATQGGGAFVAPAAG